MGDGHLSGDFDEVVERVSVWRAVCVGNSAGTQETRALKAWLRRRRVMAIATKSVLAAEEKKEEGEKVGGTSTLYTPYKPQPSS